MADPITNTFAAIVVMFVCGTHAEGLCDGKNPSKVEMKILSGSDCGLIKNSDPGVIWDFTNWDECRDHVSSIVEIQVDGKIVASIPASAIDRDSVNRLWDAMKPWTTCREDKDYICVDRKAFERLQAIITKAQ